MKVLNGTLSGAIRVRNTQSSAASASKVFVLGGTYRLFIPLTKNEQDDLDILIAMEPGRTLDYERLGRSFIVLKDWDMTDAGRFIDNSGLVPYARLARVIHDAECKAEKVKAEKEERSNAEEMGRPIDTVALKVALKEIETKYHGDRDAKPNAIYPAMNPVIGGVKTEIATEVLVVPLKTDGEPEWGKATSMTLSLSNRKAKQLIDLVNNKDYCDGTKEYLEVHYAYTGMSRQEAGLNSVYQGCSKDTSLQAKYPELWEANKDQLSRLPQTSEVIKARNATMSSTVSPKEVIQLFNKFVSKHEMALLHLDFEDDQVKASAADLLNLDIIKETPRVQEKLIEIVNCKSEENESKATLDDTDTTSSVAVESGEISTIKKLDEKVDDIDSLIGGDIDEI